MGWDCAPCAYRTMLYNHWYVMVLVFYIFICILICILISQCTLIKRGFESLFRTRMCTFTRILKHDFLLPEIVEWVETQDFSFVDMRKPSIEGFFLMWKKY